MLDPTFLAENAVNHRERTIARLARATRSGSSKAERARLRRPPARGRPAVRRVARRPRVVPGSLALPPRRRVPGHEPAAIPVGPGARREAPQPGGRRRRRPVDLRVARRRHPEHPRLRARLARRDRRQARAELPLDPADPRRRPRGRVAQHRADGQEALDRERRRPPIQRFEAYNEEEEAEWIARQVEGLTGGRGSILTRRADDDDGEPNSGPATSRSCTG